MNTLFATIIFTVLIVVVPQLVAAYFNAPSASKSEKRDKSRLAMESPSLERKDTQ